MCVCVAVILSWIRLSEGRGYGVFDEGHGYRSHKHAGIRRSQVRGRGKERGRRGSLPFDQSAPTVSVT